jgi:hypothetical protein
MDNLESNPASQPDVSELRSQCESLRQLVISLLVLLLVVSGTLSLYFWRQFRITKGALDVARPQISQMVAEYNKGQGVAIDNFVAKLKEFEKKNPDFAPILAKYGIPLGPSTSAPPATATAPAPAPAKK